MTDEEVDSYIESNILANFATEEQVTDRAAEMGDVVNIDYVGSVDGVEFDGGSAQGYDLTLAAVLSSMTSRIRSPATPPARPSM